MTDESTHTVTQVLRRQHARVKAMFDEFAHLDVTERGDLFDCLRATLAVHETAEAIVVHPVVRRMGPDAERAVAARLAEERTVKEALAELEKLTPAGDGFGVKLTAFQRDVLQHAEAEEREVFPLLEQHCDRSELDKMAEQVLAAEKLAPTHPHPHGPEGPLGLLLVGPFVAMVDKVRDKLAS